MNRFLYIPFVVVLGVTLFVFECPAFELKSRHAIITYDDRNDLKRFNKNLYMGRRLRSLVKKQGADTVEEEVVAKINVIVEKVMTALDMFQSKLVFSIVIRGYESAVQKDFKRIYDVDVNYIAFFDPHNNIVYYSANNGTLRVVAHEIGHVVVENYFTISPPQRIHEVMAQYAEKHVSD